MAKKSGLGKGLDALFIDNNTQDTAVSTLKISMIEPNKNQPRSDFSEEALAELADSIREHGVISPLVVRPIDSGGYQIVAGERRWRASRMAGLSEVPVIIKEFDDKQTLEIAIIENLQREDLNVVELAFGYKALIDEYGLTQDEVAKRLGKSRPVIANTIRLLNLPDDVLELIRDGKLTQGHAKALLALEDNDLISLIAKKAVSEGLLVRDIEKLARERKTPQKNIEEKRKEDYILGGDTYYKEMQAALSHELGRKINITKSGKVSTITIEFYSNEELADIAARLTKSSW